MTTDDDSLPNAPDTHRLHPDTETLRKYDISLTNTSLSLTINITTLLSWASAELDGYLRRGIIPTIHDLTDDWEDGRAFLCLAQRFYPTLIPQATFDTLMDKDTTDSQQPRSDMAFHVFEKELALPPPSSSATPYPLYIAKVRQALLSLNSMTGNDDDQDPWTQRTNSVMHAIQHTRQQLQALGFHSTTSSSHDDDGDMHDYLDKGGADGQSKSMTGWEEDLAVMEQALVDLAGIMDTYHIWANDSMECGSPTLGEKDRRMALVQSVDNAHNSLQEYLDQDQQALTVFRKRAIFNQATAPIRQDLDWVQAAMLKTTTTDTGIKNLEERMHHAGAALQYLIEQYSPTTTPEPDMAGGGGQQQQTHYSAEMDALVKRYQVVQSWVEDVRVWFVEAQRIRQWIAERVDLLDKSTVPNGASTEHISITADQVEDLNANHETMEKEVELFNKEDMSRLRTHVKDLTVDSAKEKDLSPADTTTIEITFTTLMALDRLLHLLRKHSHTLQVLTLRVFWENEFAKTVDWVNNTADELKLFIQSQARWQATPDSTPTSKSTVIDALLEMEMEISRFDQGQFTTTVNLYQEMDDVSDIELPSFLESRQVGVEEQFESLVHRVSFARRVVEQYLIMVDFMDSADGLLYQHGQGLSEELDRQTQKVYTLSLDQRGYALVEQKLVDKNSDFQEHAVRLITDTTVPSTEAASLLDHEENEVGNSRIKAAVESRSSELILLGETLEHKLERFKGALRWYNQFDEIRTGIQQTQNQLAQDIGAVSHLADELEATFGDQAQVLSDAWMNDKDTTGAWNQQRDHYYDKVAIYQKTLGDVATRIEGLHHQLSSSTDTTHQGAMADALGSLEKEAEGAASQLQSLTLILDQWDLGLTLMNDRQVWERFYSTATQWLATHEQKCQDTRLGATWSPSSTLTDAHYMAASTLNQEWHIFKDQSLASVIMAFDQLVNHPRQDSKWAAQRQRQTDLLSRAEHLAALLLLTKALLDQHKAMALYMDGAEEIRLQGTQWLNHLKWTILHRDMEETASMDTAGGLTLDSYNAKVESLWNQWQQSSSSGTDGSLASSEDLMADWQRQCDVVQQQVSSQQDALRSLGAGLKQWMAAAEEAQDIYGGIKLWRDKVYSLDAQAIDFLESMTVEKDALLESLSTGDDGALKYNGDAALMDLDRFRGLDRTLQQWLDHDFGALHANRSELNRRLDDLRESILDGTQDCQKTVDYTVVMNNTGSHLDHLEATCKSKLKPLLSFVFGLAGTYNRQVSWASAWLNQSSVSKKLKSQLDDLAVEKDMWLKAGDHSLAKVQALSKKVAAFGLELDDTVGLDGLSDSENSAYMKMEQSYQDLSVNDLSPVPLSSALQDDHTKCLQSIPQLRSDAAELAQVIKWLETGATWLHQADGQLDVWNSLIGDLERFTQHHARWSMDADSHPGTLGDHDSSQTVDLGATCFDLGHRVTDCIVHMNTSMEALDDWKSQAPSHAGLDGFGPWEEKMAALEIRRDNAQDYLVYASNMMNHHKAMQQWSSKVDSLEHQGEKLKSVMLLENEDMDLDGESSQHLDDFDQKLASLLNSDQIMVYPTPPSTYIDNENGHDDTKAIHQYIQSRHDYLESMSMSLHSILNAKERSTRLKALVDGYVKDATESLQWINGACDSLQKNMATDGTDMNGLETIESKLNMVHDWEKSAHLHATSHYNGLKESANHCVAAIQAGMDNQGDGMQLDKVTSLQQQLEDGWKQLSDSLQEHKTTLQLAERTYWSNQVATKCKAIDDQLDNFDSSMTNALHGDQLDQWQRDIDTIASDDLERLERLFNLDDMEDRDVNHQLLDDAKDIHWRLGKHLETVYQQVECGRRISEYTNLAAKLLASMDDLKPTLADWRSNLGTLSVESNAATDQAYYNNFKSIRGSLNDDWTALKHLYDQEEDLFAAVDHLGDELATPTDAIHARHKQVGAAWAEIQQQCTMMDQYDRLMTRRRPHFDKLHQISSLLDGISTSLYDIGDDNEEGVYAALRQVDRVDRMMTEATNAMDQQQQDDLPPISGNEAIDDVYRQRSLAVSNRLDTLKHQLETHQKRQHARRTHQQFQQRAEEIKMSAQNESSALESLVPQQNGSQQYNEWAKSVASSEKVFHDLLHESKVLLATVMETLGQSDADEIETICRLPLDDLNDLIQHQHSLLDLARQVLGHNKSANDISVWLDNFCTAVNGLPINDGSTRSLENDISILKTKLFGFEPTMASLESMNKAIQGADLSDDSNPAFLWKQSAQQQHDKVVIQWRGAKQDLEKCEDDWHRSQQATSIVDKLRLMATLTNDCRHQLEQLRQSFVSFTTNDEDPFKLLPRDPVVSQAQQALDSLERGLVANGQDLRVDIEQLVEKYYVDQQIGSNGGTGDTISQQRDEMVASWVKLMESIKVVKDTLCTEREMVKCISILDSIDVLLDSMDEVVVKAAPNYHATMVDNKYSKTELEAKRIELNARCNYYKHSIEESLQQADETWQGIGLNGDQQVLGRLATILEQHLAQQRLRHNDIFNQRVLARRLELEKALKLHMVDLTEKATRLRKSSLPTRKAAGTLIPVPRSIPSTSSLQGKPSQGTSTGLHPSSALPGRQQRLRTVSSSSSLNGDHNNNQLGLPYPPTSSSTKSTKSTSSNFPIPRKKSATPLTSGKKPNDYIAQADNDLDVEIGRIVNDMPYRVKVKMVPGEVGRYWFGDVNPKLVYCRVLKSKMVMVRVGGGWSELSQFLRDHAKLEGELIIPKPQDQHLLHTTMQEGYLETTTSLQRQRKQLMQQQNQPLKPTTSSTLLPAPRSTTVSSSIPKMKSSRSTSSSTTSQGYKNGDSFVAVDRHGNPLEVKLSKFSQKSALPTSTTNRRRKAAKP
ncbi:hypothetical protein [Absidia glauca]|uniref:GAR domain-containing protein n=1 Tax=Absidia glauca TaxID=4829 RepID=A0A168QGB5_ABSGL|nr:hypothetical protein [Absidia glauca]